MTYMTYCMINSVHRKVYILSQPPTIIMMSRTMVVDGKTFHVIIDDMSYEEKLLQKSLWGRQNIDYAVESKSNDRYRFYLSEELI